MPIITIANSKSTTSLGTASGAERKQLCHEQHLHDVTLFGVDSKSGVHHFIRKPKKLTNEFSRIVRKLDFAKKAHIWIGRPAFLMPGIKCT